MTTTQINAPRRALADMSINSYGTLPNRPTPGKLPSASHHAHAGLSLPSKGQVVQKRSIDHVDSPELSPASSRVRVLLNHKLPASSMLETSDASTAASYSSNLSLATVTLADESNEETIENESQHSNKDSLSSLIDFDPEDETSASQQTAETEMTQPVQSVARLHAETLRLRLRVAMFKVQTNQVNTPMSKLQISSQRTVTSSSLPRNPVPPKHLDQSSLPKLLPAPILRPTAYSARHITQAHIPSSPPSLANTSPEAIAQNEVFRTPALPRNRLQTDLSQTSSPLDNLKGVDQKDVEEEKLNSSVVKGRAAKSLLGLMRMA